MRNRDIDKEVSKLAQKTNGTLTEIIQEKKDEKLRK